MKKLYLNVLALLALFCVSFGAKAAGWPANYQGVMLQGFYWDSYTDTKWTSLTNQADELSKYFKLIWVPNCMKSTGGMGYMPIYWFSNFNTPFGNESQLRNMIRTYKEKGVGIIEDVVVNHRAGVSQWYDFPSETWNGTTYHMTTGSICSTDEVWRDGGHGCPASYKGAPDTGEDFDGARDLDHTNTTVQNHVKNYCKFLIDDLGFEGFRLDMVKGYGGQYTKIYNQYSKPKFCVGEFWDNYDAIAAWIDATGKESAAFDFPFKYAVNEAFASNDMSKLCWKDPSGAWKPAGMIHYGYTQYAVTFIENHDTERESYNKFNGNVLAANAFMLCSPGTPCVFLRHYLDNKAAIQKMIEIRNAVGIHNLSNVNVLKLTNNCYMAEVTGTNGKLVVRIGSSSDTPSGYTNADIKASGTGYCIWTTDAGGVIPDIPSDKPFTVYFDNTKNWTNPYIHYWGNGESTWPGVKMEKHKGNIWKYTVPAGTTGCLFNAGDGDASKTADMSAKPDHLYNPNGDQGLYDGADHSDPTPGTYPETLYLLGHVNGSSWQPDANFPAKGSNGVYKWDDVTVGDAGEGYGYFSFVTSIGPNWDDDVNISDRYGATSADESVAKGASVSIQLFNAGGNASSAYSWKILSGKYSLTADLSKMQLTIGDSSGVHGILDDEDAPAEYYNLQGVRVINPTSGIYIRVRANNAEKVVIR